MPTQPTTKFVARLPKSLHRQLKKRAERNTRSLNGELIAAVQRYLASEAQADADQPTAKKEQANG